jgi:hypothetical protein
MTRTLQERPGLPARSRRIVCSHEPQCPSAGHTARVAARVIAGHPEQGWSLLCNGIVLFDDGGLLLPDGRAEAPHARPLPRDRGTTAVRQLTQAPPAFRHAPPVADARYAGAGKVAIRQTDTARRLGHFPSQVDCRLSSTPARQKRARVHPLRRVLAALARRR